MPTTGTETTARDIAAELAAEREERMLIGSREDLAFEIEGERMGVALWGYYDIVNVPRWLGLLAREVWNALPAEHQDAAERFLELFAEADPAAITDEASRRLYDQFARETLLSAEGLCGDAGIDSLIGLACTLLETNPDGEAWSDIRDEAVSIMESSEESSPLNYLAEAVKRVANRDSYSPWHAWGLVEDASGRTEFRDADGGIRRPVDSLAKLAARILGIIAGATGNPQHPGAVAILDRPQPRRNLLKSELWVPAKCNVTLPLEAAHWIDARFPDEREREAFVSSAIIAAVESAQGERAGE